LRLDYILTCDPPPPQTQFVYLKLGKNDRTVKALPGNQGSWFSLCNLILAKLERQPQKKMEDNLLKKYERRPKKWKTTSKKMEENLKKNERRPQKKGRQPPKKMKDNLNFFWIKW
jgi:hypothetical protein